MSKEIGHNILIGIGVYLGLMIFAVEFVILLDSCKTKYKFNYFFPAQYIGCWLKEDIKE